LTIPTGNITFLFTDIEGSTKLSQKFPDTMPAAMEIHNNILLKSIESNNGFVFKNTGDGFCAAFQNAGDSVRAAVEIQTNLLNENWKDAVIKIRIGIHSGKAEWNGKNYMGYITLARTSRIMSSAFGDQIIISNDTYNLFSESNTLLQSHENIRSEKNNLISLHQSGDTKISFWDLGERRLKDLINPIKLFQITAPGLRENFPPLETLDARPNNLPVQLTSFIGREKDIKEIKKLTVDNRLVSIIGPGGIGKTRLSLQVAAELIDQYSDGVWLTEFAQISDPELISQTTAKFLGINEQSNQETIITLINYLKDKELLLIFDNCEHLVSACAVLTEKLLQNCAKLKIIVTSREAFRIEGEHLYNIISLSHPEPNEVNTPIELSQFEAVRLFIERALSVSPGFKIDNENAPALAQICYHLDGIPFAIELAAARTKILTLEKICEKLNNRFQLLTGGKRTSLPRQQTLRAMIDWSYDLLSHKEKLLLQRLSVFSGGWTIETAEQICADEEIDDSEILDLNSLLLDKSLISAKESSGSIRFFMLETIKEYTKEKLEKMNDVYRKHFSYFNQLCNCDEMRSKGLTQLQWIKLVDTELDNIRAAIQWAVEKNSDEACDIISTTGIFNNIKGYYKEGLQTCLKILNSSLSVNELPKVKVLYTAALMASNLGNSADAEYYAKEGLRVAKKYNDKHKIASCLNVLGSSINKNLERSAEALEYFEEALSIFREVNNKTEIGVLLFNMSTTVNIKGDPKLVLKYRLEAMKIFKELDDTHNISLILASLGVYELRENNFELAKNYTEESLAIAHEIGDNFLISVNLVNLGCIYSGLNQYEKAAELLERSIVIIKEHGYKESYLVAVMYLGEVFSNSGDYKRAIELFNESIQSGTDSNNDYFLAYNYFNLGVSYFKLKDYVNSLKYFYLLKSDKENSKLNISNEKLKIAEEYISKLESIE